MDIDCIGCTGFLVINLEYIGISINRFRRDGESQNLAFLIYSIFEECTSTASTRRLRRRRQEDEEEPLHNNNNNNQQQDNNNDDDDDDGMSSIASDLERLKHSLNNKSTVSTTTSSAIDMGAVFRTNSIHYQGYCPNCGYKIEQDLMRSELEELILEQQEEQQQHQHHHQQQKRRSSTSSLLRESIMSVFK